MSGREARSRQRVSEWSALESRPRLGGAFLAAVLAAALLLPAGRAAAGVLVYQSGTGGVPIETTPFFIDANTTDTIELYVAKDTATASSGGTPCVQETDGDETCGFQLKLQAEDDFFFTGFTAATLPGDDEIKSKKFLSGSEVVGPGDFDELRVNGTNIDGPWTPVQMHIGSLDVRAGSNLARVTVVSGLHVDPSGDVSQFPPGFVVIQVPEASQWLMLLAGLVLLGVLHHLRGRGTTARGCS